MDAWMKLLQREEKKLLVVSGKIGAKLSQIRAAINALLSNGTNAARVSKLCGRKLSAKHRTAIKLGIMRPKKAQAKA